jgi:hypothetical protein
LNHAIAILDVPATSADSPNFGRCEALVGFHIRNGNYGHARLDSLDFIYTASWPKAIHQGNGITRVYIDQRASAEQRAGSGLRIPLDIDVRSCQRRVGVTVCAELSGFGSAAGKQLGGTVIQNCPMGSVTNPCKYQYVGGSDAQRFTNTGEIYTSTLTSGTLYVDFSNGTGTIVQLPFDFAVQH